MTRRLSLVLLALAALGLAVAMSEDPVESDRSVPGWFTITPPLFAIVVAVILRNVIPALFLGVWLGAWGVAGGRFG